MLVAAVVVVVESGDADDADDAVDAVDATGATVVAAAAVVEPQNASTLLPACFAPAIRLRHGGASGFFGCPVASPRRYALHSPSCAGPFTSGPTPREALSSSVVDAPPAVVEVTAPAVDAAAIDPPEDVAVVVGDVVLAAVDAVEVSGSS